MVAPAVDRRRSRQDRRARLQRGPAQFVLGLYTALATLPDKLREAFVARAIEGLSLLEAAAILGAPISTISYRTRRAEQLLCAALEIPWREP